MNHIPYRGAGPAPIDQVGGQVSIGFQTATAVLPYGLGVIVPPKSAGEFGAFMQIEAEKQAKVAKAANIKAQ